IRDNVMEALSGVKGENSVKIFGPDLDRLEELAEKVKTTLDGISGIENAGIFRIKGQSNLELRVDREKCARWGVSAADVNTVIESALRGKAFSQMIEGEKLFDISLRWPERLRGSESYILNIPIDVTNNTVTPGLVASLPQTPLTGPATGASPIGTSQVMPTPSGNLFSAPSTTAGTAPRRRLRDVVTPMDASGAAPGDSFIRPGASTIYREQGNRLIAVKFGVRERDLAGAVAEAQ